jgi:Na+-translocating ferredoxin:NAD+ oxidoreductase RNF subunit RnfB
LDSQEFYKEEIKMTGIIIAAAVVSIVGLILGLFLGFMGKKFAVEVDQKEIDVRAELPGNNCGGCGYAGCDALAKAIAAGEAEVGACPVGGEPVAKKIAAIMGSEVGDSKRMTAFVKCAGDCEKAKENLKIYIEAAKQRKELFIPTGQNHLFRPYGTSYSTAESHLFLMVVQKLVHMDVWGTAHV